MAESIGEAAGEVAGEVGGYFKKTYSPKNLKKAWGGAKIAFGNAVDRPGETARDIGRGTMAGLAEVGGDFAGGFGLFENDVSRDAHKSAEWWRSGIEDKNSVGAASADEAAQLVAFGPAGKAVKYGVKAGLGGAKLVGGALKKAGANAGGKTVAAAAALGIPAATMAVDKSMDVTPSNTKPFAMKNKPKLRTNEEKLKDKATRNLMAQAIADVDGPAPSVRSKKTAPGSRTIVKEKPKKVAGKKKQVIKQRREVPEDILDLF
jgi:hypothetical protein